MKPAERRAFKDALLWVRCPSCNKQRLGVNTLTPSVILACMSCGWSGLITATFTKIQHQRGANQRTVVTSICTNEGVTLGPLGSAAFYRVLTAQPTTPEERS